MARVNSVARVNQTLLAADFRDIEELWAFQITCIREMDLISRGHVTLSRSIELRTPVTVLSTLLSVLLRGFESLINH